jgi:hypothetical protein
MNAKFVTPVLDSMVLRWLSIAPVLTFGPVAQSDRAPDFESVGRAFESPRAHKGL